MSETLKLCECSDTLCEKKNREKKLNRRLFLAAILTVLLLPPQLARAQVDFIVHYTDGDTFLDIGTFGDGAEKTVFFGISQKAAITFPKHEWKNFFVSAWERAKLASSDSFELVDYYKPSNLIHNPMLLIGAGPGIRFTILSDTGTYQFLIRPRNYSKFDADIAKISALLGPG